MTVTPIEHRRALRTKDKRIRELETIVGEYQREVGILTDRNRELQAALDDTQPKVRPISLALARALHDDGPEAA